MERYTLPSAPPPPTWTTEPPHAEDIAETAASWTTPISEPKHHPLLPFFKPEPDYYYYYNNNNNNNSSSITSTTTSDNNVVVPFVSISNPTTTTHNNNNFLMHQNTDNNMDSFPLESQSHPFFNNYNNNNPFETGFESGFFSTVNLMGLSSATELLFPPPSLELGGGASFDAPLVAQQQPTLFQKRRGTLEIPRLETGKKIKSVGVGVVDDVDVDDSGLNLYDSDENENENENGSGLNNNQNGNGGGGGDHRGNKKKGLPAKNLMAERRRRKKLNDRLYMLRSVVPKISKMDRASILGDAVDYLKELLQRINDLHNELESTPPGSLLPPPSASFHPLTPTPPTLPCRVKEDLYPGSLQSPKNQPAKVEVRVREGRAVNIHMFCSRRPGLLLSTMRALDNLGLDVQQAVISCFNGFALDVFRAEQCREGQDVLPEQIKAVLLDSAGFHGMT